MPTDDYSLEVAKIAKKLLKQYEELHTWDAVAERYGLSKPLIWRVALKHYEPKKPLIRHRLGLSVYLPAPACPKCGEVHTTRRCTKVERRYRDLFDMPTSELSWRLDNRQEF